MKIRVIITFNSQLMLRINNKINFRKIQINFQINLETYFIKITMGGIFKFKGLIHQFCSIRIIIKRIKTQIMKILILQMNVMIHLMVVMSC